jgi:hypothetical protein
MFGGEPILKWSTLKVGTVGYVGYVGWKGLSGTNTLAYYEHSYITAIKGFMTMGWYQYFYARN